MREIELDRSSDGPLLRRHSSAPARLTHSSNFYYSFFFLPREKRRAIEAIYAFARSGDDSADSLLPPAEVARQIAHHKRIIDQCYAEGCGPSREACELAGCVRRYRIPRSYLDELLRGFEMDLAGTCYETFEDLALYCYRVAGVIGLISVEIFGYQSERTKEYAVNLGTALQLVNILRDLQDDARRGRVYVPQEELARFGVQMQDLAEGRYVSPVVELLKFQARRARDYFELARRLLPAEDRRAMLPAEIMGAIYWRLLERIRARHYNVFAQPVTLSRAAKLWTALWVYLGFEW